MNPAVPAAAGSPIWQIAFVSLAIVLVLFEVFRGWRRGGARQLARLGALIAAYFAAFFGGKLLAPLAKPFIKMPDAVLPIVVGAVVALLIYAFINGLGTVLFRRTSQHDSAVVRFLCGTTGALMGVFFGAFLVWLLVIGVRAIGAVADAQTREQPGNGALVHAVDVRRRFFGESSDDSVSVMTTLARLKNSLEMGAIGNAVKKTDVVPERTYDLITKVSLLLSNPQAAERFLSFPGARELSEHSKIVALRNDQEIGQMFAQCRLWELIQDPRIIDAANDPELRADLKKFDIEAALDYALERK
jgi:uncharacterized membrane protein required for colicin V production